MGVFLYAINPETGEVVWENTGSCSDFIMQPHSSPAFAGVAPQGYLAATEDKLFLPGGRSVPAVYDRKTGEILYFKTITKTGGYDVAVGDAFFLNRGTMYDIESGDGIARTVANIITDEGIIGADGNGAIQSYSPVPTWEEYTDRRGNPAKRAVLSRLWEVNAPVEKVFLKAGSHLYCGTPGLVAAVEIPSTSASGPATVSWTAEIEGDPWNAVAANGKLFVVTLQGRVYCFGDQSREPLRHEPAAPPPSLTESSLTERATRILETTNVRDGYCLLLGVGTGDLARALADQSDLYVIAFDPDPEKVDVLRRRFTDEGIYGNRISLHTGDILSIPLAPYFASLVVSEDPAASGFGRDEGFCKRLFHVLRPYGGVACFHMTEESRNDFLEQAKAADLTRAVVGETGEFALLERSGALEGAGQWTHQYGDVANTVCSTDRLAKPPLGLMWFGGPSHTDVLPRHGHGPPQQIVDGRLFIEGIGLLTARDVYTGRELWQKDLPGLDTFDMYYNHTYVPDPFDTTYNQVHIPGANQYWTNYIVTPDVIYLVQDEICLVLETSTGKTLHEWKLPSKPEMGDLNWGYIGVYEDYLIAGGAPLYAAEKEDNVVVQANHRFGKGSRYLFVLDRHTGEVFWEREARHDFRHNAIVAAKDKVFCLDNMSQERKGLLERRGLEIGAEATLLALDIATGKEVWREEEKVFGTWLGYSNEYDILLQAGSRAGDRARDEVGQGMAAFRGSDGTLLWSSDAVYSGPCILHHDRIIPQTGGGSSSAAPTVIYSLLTGEEVFFNHPLTGESVPWNWIRFKGCNTAIASENLLLFRSASACYLDLTSEGHGTVSVGGFRSGCTSNLVAADGVLNAPDYTRTCTCSYQVQTSLALVHMPPDEPEMPFVNGWSFEFYTPPEQPAPVKQVGINFGAPGNLTAEDGTLWIEFPSVGGPSPDIPISVDPADADLFRHHPSRLERDGHGSRSDPTLAWVASSGISGNLSIRIRPFIQAGEYEEGQSIYAFEQNAWERDLAGGVAEASGSYAVPVPYRVRLHFAEMEDLSPGQRVFDVTLQGKKVLEGFDIASAAEGARRTIVKEFSDVPIQDILEIGISSKDPESPHRPVLCGVELMQGTVD